MERDREEFVQVLSDFADYLDQQIVRPAVGELGEIAERIDPDRPKRRSEMLGEYIRESAVLILVFIPIDLLIPRLLDGRREFSHPWVWVVATLILSLGLLWIGMKVEEL